MKTLNRGFTSSGSCSNLERFLSLASERYLPWVQFTCFDCAALMWSWLQGDFCFSRGFRTDADGKSDGERWDRRLEWMNLQRMISIEDINDEHCDWSFLQYY